MSTNVTDPSQCTYATCSIAEYGELSYIPSLAGNIFYLAGFVAYLVAQITLGFRYRTWSYLIAMAGGLVLEIVGYIGRIMLRHDDFSQNNFVIYLVGLTIGPAFFSAAIYLCLSHIITVFGTNPSYFRAKTITTVFICCDVVSLILQATGGGMVATSNGPSSTRTDGLDIMIAGLASQVASMTVFVCVCIQLAWAIRRNLAQFNPNSVKLRHSWGFKLFLPAIAIATITILIRCCFRVAELKGGFGSSLANDQPAFMVLDGAMMVIAVSCLTGGHPGSILDPVWHSYRGNRDVRDPRNTEDPSFVTLEEAENR